MGFDVKTRLSQLKSSAKQRGIQVNLDINKYQILVDMGCHFCGSSLENENGYCLDRVDSDKGYTINNVVGCCKICNRAKSNMCVWDFANWLIKAAEHTKKQIQTAQDMMAIGMTVELNDKIAEFMFQELNKELPKNRIKFVP